MHLDCFINTRGTMRYRRGLVWSLEPCRNPGVKDVKMTIAKIEDVRRVDLSDAAEARLLECALACGGVVVFDRMALERRMVETVALLAELDDALTLPAVIRDRVPQC